MKYLKMLGLAAVSAMALMAVGAGTASATTLEVGGVTQNKSVTITASLAAGETATLRDTEKFSLNTCTESHAHGTTTVFTGSTVTGEFTEGEGGLKFSGCTRSVTVHKSGTLHVSHTGTTNGTVSSSSAEVTSGSIFGYLNCKTGAGTHLGTLTGVSSGHATLHINAVLTCSGISSVWEATYTVTTEGLGVSA